MGYGLQATGYRPQALWPLADGRGTRRRVRSPCVQLDDIAPDDLTAYLRLRSWIPDSARVVAVEKAGEGNMNLVQRIRLDDGDSLILKQGRSWVEKYPAITAPADRTLVEGAFYGVVEAWPAVASRMPRCLGLDRSDRVLALEDCGAGADYTSMYRGVPPDPALVEALAVYLLTLHGIPIHDESRDRLVNADMRALNHEHIFRLPLAPDNGIDLDAVCPGLRAAADAFTRDAEFVTRVHALGTDYLTADGPDLLHGDFFPGSWLDTPRGLRVIDPEFCFSGPAEFDLGVCLAHFRLAGWPASPGQQLLKHYRRAAEVDDRQVAAWAGVEMMRRLIGVAQLPLTFDLRARRELLVEARTLVLGLRRLEDPS
jgi:5-methylthioribose kinase